MHRRRLIFLVTLLAMLIAFCVAPYAAQAQQPTYPPQGLAGFHVGPAHLQANYRPMFDHQARRETRLENRCDRIERLPAVESTATYQPIVVAEKKPAETDKSYHVAIIAAVLAGALLGAASRFLIPDSGGP